MIAPAASAARAVVVDQHLCSEDLLLIGFTPTHRRRGEIQKCRPAVFQRKQTEFVECFNSENRHKRKRTCTEKRNSEGRWRSFDYEELIKRDKVNFDIFWLKDKSLEDSEDLPEPDVLAQEIADDLQTALDPFTVNAGELKE